MEKMEKKVLEIAKEVESLDSAAQREIIEALFAGFERKDQLRWFHWVCRLNRPEEVWQRVESWMEGQFRREGKKRPGTVASRCVTYFRMDPRMTPFLVKTAQRVKSRIRKRMRKAQK